MAVQADVALLHEIEKPSRGRHQDVEPAVQGLDLGELADATENNGMTETHMAAVGRGAFGDLCRQFPGRCQDQDARPAALGLPLMQGQILQNGQDESRGFPRAGLGAADQVAAGKQMGDGLGLDGGRRGVSLLGDRALEFGQQGRKHAGGLPLSGIGRG